MIDLDPTLNLSKLFFITAFVVPIGVVELGESFHWRAAKQLPVEQGVVVRREEFRRWGGIPAGSLHIRMVKDKALVQAQMSPSEMRKTPNAVQVHYGGNAKDEVVLATEPNPIWNVLLFWGLLGVLWMVYVGPRIKATAIEAPRGAAPLSSSNPKPNQLTCVH